MLLHTHDHISLPVTQGSKLRSNMHITSYSSSKVRANSHSGPGHTTRHICTLRRGGPMPNVPPVHTLSISMLKHSANARRWPPAFLGGHRVPCPCRAISKMHQAKFYCITRCVALKRTRGLLSHAQPRVIIFHPALARRAPTRPTSRGAFAP